MKRYLCIHGHFYQPPRENPWLGEVEVEDSAHPYHDWNERITAECYAPNAASRILDAERRIIDMVNNYANMSFDVGPTLLSWLERHAAEVYGAIIEGDRLSQSAFSGHGSAIAQAYNHMIMPLAPSRDKKTQVIWSILDFQHRFGRKPEGLWLPETAVDLDTLDIMAEQGMKFTILAPHQARRVRRIGAMEWEDVTTGEIDPSMVYLCHLPSGRSISLFFYNGAISRDVAFGDLLGNGEVFASRLLGAFRKNHDRAQLVHIATDGESYGHHHRFGDMALAYALHKIPANDVAQLTNYGEYLERHPATCEVEIGQDTSWGCVHGIERWRSDCGCNTGTHPGWRQSWRAPFRESMDSLRDSLSPLYEREMSACMEDPWGARDDYIRVVLDRSPENLERFFDRHARQELSRDKKVRVLKLLEMQRHAMSMYTSCGWFFDDISGIEAMQVMRHAARAMQLARETGGPDLEPDYVSKLEEAPSNSSDLKNGARVYELFVKPTCLDLLRVAAHYALSSLFKEHSETTKICCYTARSEIYDLNEAGVQKLAVGRASLRSDLTWEESAVAFAVLYLGNHTLMGGVSDWGGEDSFQLMHNQMRDAFIRSDVPQLISLMDKHFGERRYSLWHLFKDEQRTVLNKMLGSTLAEIETSFRQILEHHYSLIRAMREAGIPIPKAFATPLEFVLNVDLQRLLEREELDLDGIRKTAGEMKRLSLEPDRATLSFVTSRAIDSLMEKLSRRPGDVSLLQDLAGIFGLLSGLPLDLELWRSQNIYFSIAKQLQGGMREAAEKGEERAKEWVEQFGRLGDYLHVRCI